MTPSATHTHRLRCACDSLGADRLILGTDFPHETRDLFQRAIDYIKQSGLDEQGAECSLDTNAPYLPGVQPGDVAAWLAAQGVGR
jgi:6-methylsalicylate decarboxylase